MLSMVYVLFGGLQGARENGFPKLNFQEPGWEAPWESTEKREVSLNLFLCIVFLRVAGSLSVEQL